MKRRRQRYDPELEEGWNPKPNKGRRFSTDPKPEVFPNETIYCRWCEQETLHTVSPFMGEKFKLCTKCGEMRTKRGDAVPRVKREESTVSKCNIFEPLPEPSLYEPHDVVPDFGNWKVFKRCPDCNRTTMHSRSLQKISRDWIFRCDECGNIVNAQ